MKEIRLNCNSLQDAILLKSKCESICPGDYIISIQRGTAVIAKIHEKDEKRFYQELSQ